MFADYELRAHRLAEQDQPITAEILTETYTQLLKDYYGDAVDMNAVHRHHLVAHPALLQFAVLRLSIRDVLRVGGEDRASRSWPAERTRDAARERFLDLLRSGGSDYPMELLRKAGVDLSQPDTVRAVVDQLDDLVTRLEQELEAL